MKHSNKKLCWLVLLLDLVLIFTTVAGWYIFHKELFHAIFNWAWLFGITLAIVLAVCDTVVLFKEDNSEE